MIYVDPSGHSAKGGKGDEDDEWVFDEIVVKGKRPSRDTRPELMDLSIYASSFNYNDAWGEIPYWIEAQWIQLQMQLASLYGGHSVALGGNLGGGGDGSGGSGGSSKGNSNMQSGSSTVAVFSGFVGAVDLAQSTKEVIIDSAIKYGKKMGLNLSPEELGWIKNYKSGLKALGVSMYITGTFADSYQAAKSIIMQQPDMYRNLGKASTSILVGTYATFVFTGPVGWAIGGTYFILDASGAVDKAWAWATNEIK